MFLKRNKREEKKNVGIINFKSNFNRRGSKQNQVVVNDNDNDNDNGSIQHQHSNQQGSSSRVISIDTSITYGSVRSAHATTNTRHSKSLRTTTNITMNNFSIAAILSTAFSYSCIVTTFFLLTGPIECQRIENESAQYFHHVVGKSIALGGFAALAGLAQLITPLIGLLSDLYVPPSRKEYKLLHLLGKRMPYLILGTLLVLSGLVGMIWSRSPIHPVYIQNCDDDNDNDNDDGGCNRNNNYYSSNSNNNNFQGQGNLLSPLLHQGHDVALSGAWMQYTIFFLITMLGLNMVYTVMIVLIPDLVPPSQTGIANGTLALLVVSGSLFGFFSFHNILENNVVGMYKMYLFVTVVAAVLTCIFVYKRESVLKSTVDSTTAGILSPPLLLSDGNDDEYGIENDDDNGDDDVSSIYVDHHTAAEDHAQQSINGGDDTSIANRTIETEKDEEKEKEAPFPPLHTIVYILLYEPIMNKTRSEMIAAYWIDTTEHHDFFIVTISRFFYYMGISSQTFFLYFIHDMLRQSARTANPEAAVALLAIVGQSSGAITCYPVGVLSDDYMGGRRKPFVYTACILLAFGNVGLLLCQTLPQMIGVCALLGAANGMYLTMDTSLAVDTLDIEVEEDGDLIYDIEEEEEGAGGVDTSTGEKDDDEEIKAILHDKKKVTNHDHGAAQLLGVWGVFGFIGSALGPLIGGTALLVLGNTSSSDGIDVSGSTMTGSSTDSVGDTTTSVNNVFSSSPFYKIQGYEALFSLSAFYFFCSALSLALVRKKGV